MAYLEPEQWYRQLATCHAAASGLITDPDGRVLLVKPNYRDGWSLPGGVLEDDERPENGCARELDGYRFVAADRAADLFPAWAVGRLGAALAARDSGTTVYLPLFTAG